MNWMFWLILTIVLAIIEACTTSLLTIWFVISGIVTLLLSFLIDNIATETAIFMVLGIILLFTTRPIFKKYIKPKNVSTNLDSVVGMVAIVTEEISEDKIGEVKVAGKKWSAKSTENIKVGEKVIVKSIEGVKLLVRRESDK